MTCDALSHGEYIMSNLLPDSIPDASQRGRSEQCLLCARHQSKKFSLRNRLMLAHHGEVGTGTQRG